MSQRALILALLASAALNVFAIGAAVGVFASGALGPGHGGPPPNPLRAAAARLPAADREGLTQLMEDQLQTSGPLLLDARQARHQARGLMQANPFDPVATKAALARARADETKVRGDLEAAVVDFAARLSPQERAVLAEGMTHPPHGGPHRGLMAGLGAASAPPPGPPSGGP
jgi:uncharacterized membrane protein